MARKKGGKAWKGILAIVVAMLIVDVIQMIANDNQPTRNIAIADIENVIIPDNITNKTYQYTGFTVYFNPDTHIPNCTVYELTANEASGTNPRDDNFHHDSNVEGCPFLDDYKYSGYDRGHMVPAGDMKWNTQAMSDCFSLANMVPQKKSLNSGAWNKLEQKVRNWAMRDSALIVITGPIINKQDLDNTIGVSKVVVPGSIYKVILAHHASPMRAIAFIYPNEKPMGGLEKHIVTVDDVERATGLDFFSTLPDDIENKIEAVSDLNQWNKRATKAKK